MRDWKFIILIVVLAIIGITAIHYLFPAVSALQNYTGPIPYYIQQGDTVYVNQTIDISGVVPPYQYLAYWDGFTMYDRNATYLIPMSYKKSTYYNFYLDPDIFSNRLGKWYRYDLKFEPNGNNLAFVVKRAQPIPVANKSMNETLQNANQTPAEIPPAPPLPIKHIADYLVARGDSFSIKGDRAVSVWLFGARDSLLDYHMYNNSAVIAPQLISTLSPGRYTVLLQEQEPGYEGDPAIRYDNISQSIQWFDSSTFTIQGFSVLDQTPDNVLKQLEEVFPKTHYQYQKFTLEIQDPTISIDQIDSLNQLNNTGAPQAQGLILGSQSYIDVRGYTNAAPDTLIQVGVDVDFNMGGDPWKGTIATASQGDPGGDMREWKALIPLKLYDMKAGRHFVSAKSDLSDAIISTADFFIYDNPVGNSVVPNKTIRYISGRYGPEEMVPTPTPVVVTQVVTQVITQIVTVPVTPSNEQVLAQQRIAQKEISDQNWKRNVTYTGFGIVAIGFILTVIWMISAWRRSKV